MIYDMLPPTGKSTLKLFFAFIALQFWEMALLFYFYIGKFGFNIFPDLKSKQIKYLKNYKKTKFAYFFNKVCLHFLFEFNQFICSNLFISVKSY